MKEKIYTIPVIDGFRDSDGGCPFCAMYKKLDDSAIEYMLGPAYMEDDIRMSTNEQGFCKRHYESMYAQQNRLGLGLMTHTHLQKINRDLAVFTEPPQKPGLFKKPKEQGNIVNYLKGIQSQCFICNKINATFERYIDTFFHLWTREPEIVETVKACGGFCLEHFTLLLENAEKKLGGAEYQKFHVAVLTLQMRHMKQLEDEADLFVKQFDYRSRSSPADPNMLRQVLPRALGCLSRTDIQSE